LALTIYIHSFFNHFNPIANNNVTNPKEKQENSFGDHTSSLGLVIDIYIDDPRYTEITFKLTYRIISSEVLYNPPFSIVKAVVIVIR
jgi:hypothetical protein